MSAVNQRDITNRVIHLKEMLPTAEGEDLRTAIIQLRTILPKSDKILRIDADSLIYMVAYAPSYKPEASIEGGTFEGDVINTNFKQYKLHFKSLVDEVVQACEKESYLGNMVRFSDYELVFTPRTNFRYDIFPEYKKSRVDKPQSNKLKRLKRYVKTYLGIVPEGIEADDYVYRHGLKGHPIASGDKDVIYSIPGGVYWYHYKHKEVITNTKESAARFVLLQSLAGDSSDDIPGIAGVGMKTKILPAEATFNDVVEIYQRYALCIRCMQLPKAAAVLMDKIEDLECDGDITGICKKCNTNRVFYRYTKEDAILTRRLIGLDQWNGRRVRLFKG